MRKSLVAALLCLPVLVSAAPAAQAAAPRSGDTPAVVLQVPVRTITWDLTSNSPNTRRDNYTRFIQALHDTGSLLSGAGSARVWQTSTGNEVIGVNVTYTSGGENRTLTLYITARNLYLRGFSAGPGGDVVQLNDEDYDLGHEIDRPSVRLPYNGRYGGGGSLGYSYYNDRRITVSPQSLADRMNELWTYARDGGNANNLRYAVLTAIGVTSEAARFRNIEGTVREGVGSSAQLSAQEAAEENDWGQGSTFMYAARNQTNPTPTRLGQITLSTYAQATPYIAMVQHY